MRKKIYLFVIMLLATVGVWAQTPVLELTSNQIGTSYPYTLSEADAENVIALGTYPINSTGFDGTVLASTGMDWEGNVMPSYYAGYMEGWLLEPFYFFVSGEVVVYKNEAGELALEINALNSCDIPVHIVYDGTPINTAVENTQSPMTRSQKLLRNGHLIIKNAGAEYNAQGMKL
mgnify:CR=1 FL=1